MFDPEESLAPGRAALILPTLQNMQVLPLSILELNEALCGAFFSRTVLYGRRKHQSRARSVPQRGLGSSGRPRLVHPRCVPRASKRHFREQVQ